MESLICLGLMLAGMWLVGRAIIIEKSADINEMGFALVMGALGMIVFTIAFSWMAVGVYFDLAGGY